MIEARHIRQEPAGGSRLANWDLLRSLAMFCVVVVHCAGSLGPIRGVDTRMPIAELFLICDPVFFCLSGYFALRPQKRGLAAYWLGKFSSIVLPVLLYAIPVYAYQVRAGIQAPSASGYVAFLLDQIQGGWWFVPRLIPFLVLAPFLYRMLDALDDRQLVALCWVVAVLAAWGATYDVSSQLLSLAGHGTWAALLGVVAQLVPSSLIPGSGYLVFFAMGYAVRRLSRKVSGHQLAAIVAVGAVAWIADDVQRSSGLTRFDPSWYWVFTTFAIFLLFDRVRIRSNTARRVLTWTARRSYAIYLVQYTTNTVAASWLYGGFFGDVTGLPALARMGVWLLLPPLSYLMALAVASVIDPTALRLAQWAWGRLTAWTATTEA